jgi:hypothetical protein
LLRLLSVNATKPSNDIEKLPRADIRLGYILDDHIGMKAVIVRRRSVKSVIQTSDST